MSDKTGQEKKKEVVISPEDCMAAIDFWKHFNIPIPNSLDVALAAFSSNPSIENQELVKLEVCKAISTTDHEAFKDEMFKRITEECESATFDMEFDKDFEAEVSVKE